MIDFTKPVQTRDGRPVEILSANGRGPKPIKGYVADNIDLCSWTTDGKIYQGDTMFERGSDLVNVPPPKKVMYINVYGDGNFSCFYRSRTEADRGATIRRQACVRVEYTKGQFDE